MMYIKMNKNNYRPASKTESSLDFKKVNLIENEFRFTINDSSLNGSAKLKSVDSETQTDFDYIELGINKLIMFIQIHLLFDHHLVN